MFDEKEIFDIVISTIVLSFAFYFYLHNFSFIAVLLIVFTSFVLHELGHKFVAILFGCESRYEISYPFLITSFIVAYLSSWRIIFAAPGAVVSYKSGMSEREEGLISLAGPMMNVLVAVICLYLMYHTSYLSFLQTLGLFNCFLCTVRRNTVFGEKRSGFEKMIAVILPKKENTLAKGSTPSQG